MLRAFGGRNAIGAPIAAGGRPIARRSPHRRPALIAALRTAACRRSPPRFLSILRNRPRNRPAELGLSAMVNGLSLKQPISLSFQGSRHRLWHRTGSLRPLTGRCRKER
jgi:hypothetical protein